MNLSGYRTYIGLIVAAVPTIAGIFGFDTAANFTPEVTELFEQLLTLIGLGIAFYGRAKATVPGWFAKK